MWQDIRFRGAILAFLLAISLVYLAPNIFKMAGGIPSWWKGTLPDKTVNLGLDLRGGMYVVLEVDIDEGLLSEIDQTSAVLETMLKKNNFPVDAVGAIPDLSIDDPSLIVTVAQNADPSVVRNFIEEKFWKYGFVEKTPGPEGSTELKYRVEPRYIMEMKENWLRQSVETIRRRVDSLGVREPAIQQQGDNRVLLQLPGVEDPGRVKEIIGKTARLDFMLVDEEASNAFPIQTKINELKQVDPSVAYDIDKINELLAGELPEGTEVFFHNRVDRNTGRIDKSPTLLKKRIEMAGTSITDAGVRFSPDFNEPYVWFNLSDEGARTFAELTGANVGRQLAIVLDGAVMSAPVIKTKIGGGEGMIEGRFNEEDARDLALVLRSGALPAPVNIVEERTVGASLGEDSIRAGLTAIGLAGVCVLIFMVVYYGFAGLIANIALLLNIIFVFAALSVMQATLTLPGLAGIALTIGLAVDANVISFERVREERSRDPGMSAKTAIANGYANSRSAIFDANITTLLAALILLQFGTGPVKGFAVTLSLGVISSVYTAYFVTRMIFDYLIDRYDWASKEF
jgi:preprotein translocase subunit SecD